MNLMRVRHKNLLCSCESILFVLCISINKTINTVVCMEQCMQQPVFTPTIIHCTIFVWFKQCVQMVMTRQQNMLVLGSYI